LTGKKIYNLLLRPDTLGSLFCKSKEDRLRFDGEIKGVFCSFAERKEPKELSALATSFALKDSAEPIIKVFCRAFFQKSDRFFSANRDFECEKDSCCNKKITAEP